MRIMSFHENSMPHSVKTGSVSVMIQPAKNTRITRMIIASVRPRLRARACCSFGSFEASTEMKMTLSTPRTISRTKSVRKIAMFSGVKAMLKSTAPC